MATILPRTDWQAVDRAEVMGHRESLVNVGAVAAGGSVVIDPTIASNWVIDAAGAVTVRVVVPPAEAANGAASTGYLYGLKVWVLRPVGAVVSFPGVLWSQDVRNPDGDAGTNDSLVGKASTEGGSDVYVLTVLPGRGTWGFLAGRGYA